MEYYHLHTKGIQDKFWKVKREFIIDDKFNNRLYKHFSKFTTTTPCDKFEDLVDHINHVYLSNGFSPLIDRVSVDDLISCLLNTGIGINQLKDLLKQAQETIYNARIFKREMALENYRKENVPHLPSRLHSLYVTTEEGINYWGNLLIDNDLEVFRLGLDEEPFATDEQFLPNEGLSYANTYKAAQKYWFPKLNEETMETREYLAKGRVRILEKVAEIHR